MQNIEKEKLEKEIAELEVEIKKLAEDKKDVVDSMNNNQFLSKLWLYGGIAMSTINYALTYKGDYACAIMDNNIDLNSLKINDIPVDFHTYFGLMGALFILPVPVILSIFYKTMQMADREQLEYLIEAITNQKIELGSKYTQLNEYEGSNALIRKLKKED